MVGDVRERLRELPAASVQCVVTSPPYWGLRDYGTARWEGGAANCGHVAPALGGTGKETISGGTANQHTTRAVQYRDTCGKCGAHRIDAQLGLERTPEEYVTNMVAVFREVRRVLRDDGTLWLNLGDSYARSEGERRRRQQHDVGGHAVEWERAAIRAAIRRARPEAEGSGRHPVARRLRVAG
jgi:DNA modification methylase